MPEELKQAPPTDSSKAQEVLQKHAEDPKASAEAAVKDWNKKISKAREKYLPDFKRFEENQGFVAGLQYPGQKKIKTDKYIANITLKVLKSIESQIYARDPKIGVKRRKRMDFTIWDEQLESKQQAQMMAMMPMVATDEQQAVTQMAAKMKAQQLLADIEQGETWRKLVDRVAKTLEITYEWNIANLRPNFKEQVKSAVTQALTCGVAYCKTDFSREYEGQLTHTEIESTITDRAKKAKRIQERMEKGDIQSDSKDIETFKQLAGSVLNSVAKNDQNNVHERLCWDFLPSNSIIPDPDCTNIKNFVGADWICHEMYLPLETINAYYEKEIKPDEIKAYTAQGETEMQPLSEKKDKHCLRQVWQLSTKSHFVILDGYKEYLLEPSPIDPETNDFWPVEVLVFNNITSNDAPKNKVSIFPPSHVDLIRSQQIEWNKCGQSLSKQRDIRAPKYAVSASAFPDNNDGDLDKLTSAEDGEVIKVKAMAPGDDIAKVLQPIKHPALEVMLYDKSMILQDVQMASSSQSANLGAPGRRETATGETIAEQSRTSILSSYVDSLDSFLSGLARRGGEILLRNGTKETVQRIAGRGAAWPQTQQERDEMVQAMWLDIKAASSGRPNQALRISNAERLGPLIIQALSNPAMIPLVEMFAEVLDEPLDVTRIFAAMQQQQPPMSQPAPQPQQGHKPLPPPAPHQPPHQQQLGNGSPVLAK